MKRKRKRERRDKHEKKKIGKKKLFIYKDNKMVEILRGWMVIPPK